MRRLEALDAADDSDRRAAAHAVAAAAARLRLEDERHDGAMAALESRLRARAEVEAAQVRPAQPSPPRAVRARLCAVCWAAVRGRVGARACGVVGAAMCAGRAAQARGGRGGWCRKGSRPLLVMRFVGCSLLVLGGAVSACCTM
jgi:hypothetical protein